MYSYEFEKKALFTDEGQRLFLKIRDQVKDHIKKAGAVRMQEAMSGFAGDSWTMMACLDRMVELGEITEVTASNAVAGQYRIFTS